MTPGIITNQLVDEVSFLLEKEAGFRREDMSFEIQDDFNFLLISISVDDLVGVDQVLLFKKVSRLLNQLMPRRKGDYSWMVNFTGRGKIIDSYFGGDLDSPYSGL